MRIEWSELSERQLQDIFDYYSVEANLKIARKIINRIIGGFPFWNVIHLLERKKNF